MTNWENVVSGKELISAKNKRNYFARIRRRRLGIC